MLTTKENFKGNNKLLVGIVLAVLSFWLFAQSILNMGPDVQSSLGISSGAMDIGVSSTALFSGLFIVVTGGLADKLGRVKFTFIGLCLNIIGSLLIVLANGAVLFIMDVFFKDWQQLLLCHQQWPWLKRTMMVKIDNVQLVSGQSDHGVAQVYVLILVERWQVL